MAYADFMKINDIIPAYTPVEIAKKNEPELILYRETANRLQGKEEKKFFLEKGSENLYSNKEFGGGERTQLSRYTGLITKEKNKETILPSTTDNL